MSNAVDMQEIRDDIVPFKNRITTSVNYGYNTFKITEMRAIHWLFVAIDHLRFS